MSVHLIYETHSISTDNEAGIATGWLPGDLSTAGREGAAELGARRRDGTDVVFVSDLRRAVQTADIAFGDTDIPIFQDERLRECNYGALNGASVEQVTAVRRQHIDVPFPGGQSYRQVVAQMESFLRDLVRTWDGGCVVVIAHSANRWALDHILRGIPLEDLVDADFNWQPGWEYTITVPHSHATSDREAGRTRSDCGTGSQAIIPRL